MNKITKIKLTDATSYRFAQGFHNLVLSGMMLNGLFEELAALDSENPVDLSDLPISIQPLDPNDSVLYFIKEYKLEARVSHATRIEMALVVYVR